MNEQLVFFSLSKNELTTLIEQAIEKVFRQNKIDLKKRELFNSKQLCEWLQISNSTLNVLKRENKIPYKRMGKRIFFSKIEVVEALKESNYSRLKELGA